MKFLTLILILSKTALSDWITIPSYGDPHWKPPVTTQAALPVSSNLQGDCRTAKDSGTIYCWTGSAWSAQGGLPGGSSGDVQFNNGGAFAGDDNLFWDNDNHRLGIGTNAPAAPLDVVGGTNVVLNLLSGNPSFGSSFQISSDSNSFAFSVLGTGFTFPPSAPGDFQFFNTNANQPQMILQNNGDISLVPVQGNVGIGTNVPANVLDIIESVDSHVSVAVTNQNGGESAQAVHACFNDANNYANLAILGTGFTGGGTIYPADSAYINTNASNGMEFVSTTATGPISFFTNGDMANPPNLYIGPGNFIGLGTATPGNNLDIVTNENRNSQIAITNSNAGAAADSVFGMTNDTGHYVNFVLTSTGYAGAAPYLADFAFFNTSASNGIGFLVAGAGPIGFYTNSSANPEFKVDSAGHLIAGDSTKTPSVGVDCGTGASIVGNDNAGQVTVGTDGGGVTTCTVTFHDAWGTAPVCFFNAGFNLALSSAMTTTTMVLSTSPGTLDSDVIAYHCVGY